MKGVQKKIGDLKAILGICRAMMAQRQLDALLDLIIRETSEIMEAERTSIFLVDYETNELWSRIAQDAEIKEIRMPAAKGIAGHVAQTRSIVNIKDAYKDPRFNQEIDRKTGYKTRTILCAPMIDHEDIVTGVIQVLNKKDGVFEEYDESLITAISAQAAMAVENTQLYQERELTLKSSLKAIGALVDARDPVTAGHSDRVARYAVAIGKAIGMNESDLKALEYAAALHDVGKIGVRDNVLLKPGRLTPEEFKSMQQHAPITKSTLEQIHFSREFREVAHIAGAHHEKLNGSGYPFGLKGDQISRGARILAIADVYDALVSYDRPYKRAMPPAEALAILEQGKGTQFDAELLDVFTGKKLYELERREFRRINAELAIEYAFMKQKDSGPNRSTDTRTMNISAGGLLFPARENIPDGTFLDAIVHLPDVHLEVICKVVHCKPNADNTSYEIGVRFVNIAQAVKERLAEYLVTLPETQPS